MSNKTQPTHRAYVNLGTQEKPRYREIGALWAHKEGTGFNFTPDLLPVKPTTILFFANKPKDEQADEGSAQ